MREALRFCVVLTAITATGCAADWVLLEIDAICGSERCTAGVDFDSIEVSLWQAGPGGLSPDQLQESNRSRLGADVFAIDNDVSLPVEVLLEPNRSAPKLMQAALTLKLDGAAVGEVVAELSWERGQTNRAPIVVPVAPAPP